jgi:putative NIF3 family GTP cyclohydrolase 1 type 2
VEKIGVCVDPTEHNILAAARKGVELLISHHPWQGEAAGELTAKGMGLYRLHSAWNRAPEGNNITLARLLNLSDLETAGDVVFGMTDLSLKELLICCQRILEVNVIPYSGDLNARITRVAVVAGTGFFPVYKEAWAEWLAAGCNVVLSSELSRYSMNYFARHGVNLIDLGHSLMAKPGMAHLAYLLQNRLKAFDCEVEFFPHLYTVDYSIGFIYPGLVELAAEKED